jgi:hypothetical protein
MLYIESEEAGISVKTFDAHNVPEAVLRANATLLKTPNQKEMKPDGAITR